MRVLYKSFREPSLFYSVCGRKVYFFSIRRLSLSGIMPCFRLVHVAFLGSSYVELLELIPKLTILRLIPGGDSKENSNLKNLLNMISAAT
jgi:hypothetical protein